MFAFMSSYIICLKIYTIISFMVITFVTDQINSFTYKTSIIT